MSDWNPQNTLNKWLNKNYQPFKKQKKNWFKPPIYFYREDEYIPVEVLEEIVIKTAKIVDELGVEYISLFERAEKELKKAQENLNTLERIRNINHKHQQLYLKGNFIKPNFLLRECWTKAISRTTIFMSH